MHRARYLRTAMIASSLLWANAEAAAQDLLFEMLDPVPGAFIGNQVTATGDVDADGVVDILTTSRGPAHPTGAVYVLSGFDGRVLHQVDGTPGDNSFGSSIAGGADLDGDGLADFLVGAPTFPDAREIGQVRVFSGRDGSTLYTFDGEADKSWFGLSIDLIDGDGVKEIVVGAPHVDILNPLLFPGRVYVYSGATGSLIHRIESPADEPFFGEDVSALGEVDGDAVADFGIRSALNRAFVYSGRDGSMIRDYSETDDNLNSFRMYGLTRAGDLDNDGRADVLVSGTAHLVVGGEADDSGANHRLLGPHGRNPLSTQGGASRFR